LAVLPIVDEYWPEQRGWAVFTPTPVVVPIVDEYWPEQRGWTQHLGIYCKIIHPSPGACVDGTANVQFNLVAILPRTVDLTSASTTAYIDGVKVYDGGAGGFQAGYTVGSSITDNSTALEDVQSFDINPATPLADGNHTVHVFAVDDLGADMAPCTWSFCVETVPAQPLDVDGIPSAGAHGVPLLGQVIEPAGLPSAGVHGTPTLTPSNTILVDGIPSDGAHGTIAIAGPLPVDGIPSAGAHGTPSFGQTIAVDGLPSDGAHGVPSVFLGQLLTPDGIPSAGSHGNLHIAGPLPVDGIPSDGIHGVPTLTSNYALLVDGIPSAGAHGTLSIGQGIQLDGIPSGGAHGNLHIAGPLPVDGIPSGGAHGRLTIRAIPPFEITPDTGPASGGTRVLVRGAVVDVTGCSDNFNGAAISGLWAPVQVTPRPGQARYVFDTTGTPGSTAQLQSVGTWQNLDVQVRFATELWDAPYADTTLSLASLSLDLPGAGGRYVAIAVERRADRRMVISAEAQPSGVRIERVLAERTPDRPAFTLRLLRSGVRVWAFLGDELLGVLPWGGGGLAHVRMSCANDPSATASRVVTRAFGYLRRPVLRFGVQNEPSLDWRQLELYHATATTPAVVCAADTVDVSVDGCDLTATLEDGFTFTRDADLVRWNGVQGTLFICNDPVLKRSR